MIPDLKALWDSMIFTSLRFAEPVAAIKAASARYQAVEGTTGVPWQIIGCLHQRESDGNFRTHLHNGDPLTARTVHVPAGRPLNGVPPFTWEFSSRDALSQAGLCGLTNWTDIATALYRIERFNGLGYRPHDILSPYLWAGTNHYSSGKFASDGVYEHTLIDAQPGCAGMLSLLGYGVSTPQTSTLTPSTPPPLNPSGLSITPTFGPSITVDDQAVS